MIQYDSDFQERISIKPLIMSSNMRIIKICEFCKNEFVFKTTITQCCSDACAKRLYKVKKKNEAISRAKLETKVKRKPEAFITEGKIKVIQATKRLSLKKPTFLFNARRH